MLRDEQKLIEYFADAPDDISLSDVNLDNLPSHISVIMDGNGRWATRQGKERGEGQR